MGNRATIVDAQINSPHKRLKAFDKAHLRRYSFDSLDLEKELIGLFQEQLPVLISRISVVQTQDDWRLATHTLKGSARAVGAPELAALALELEQLGVQTDPAQRQSFVDRLERAARAFSKAADRHFRKR